MSSDTSTKTYGEYRKHQTHDIKFLIELEKVIFSLVEENFDYSVQQTMKFFDLDLPNTFNVIINKLVFNAFSSQNGEFDIYFNYLKAVQAKEEEIDHDVPNIILILYKFLDKNRSQEAAYIKYQEFMAEISKSLSVNYPKFSFIDKVRFINLPKMGHNPNEIAKIIRNDEIERLQEISSQSNFDYNQRIEPSYYERCSLANQNNVKLIDYAAFFSSVKCFKYLLMNGAKVENTGKYAIAGGNEEIIHLCEQNHSSFKDAHETAIMFHRNDIFKYVYENNLENLNNQMNTLSTFRCKVNKINNLVCTCIKYQNYEILLFLEGKGLEIDDRIINESAKTGNLYPVKYFLQNYKIPKSVLVFASYSENIELVKYVLEHKELDVNAKFVCLIKFKFILMIWILSKYFWICSDNLIFILLIDDLF